MVPVLVPSLLLSLDTYSYSRESGRSVRNIFDFWVPGSGFLASFSAGSASVHSNREASSKRTGSVDSRMSRGGGWAVDHALWEFLSSCCLWWESWVEECILSCLSVLVVCTCVAA